MRKRKSDKKKAARTVFLVICEGETEGKYIEQLKLFYRRPIIIKTKVCGTKINQRLIAQYIAELGIAKDDSYQVFFVYDADVHHIVDKLRRLNGSLILSNPCIELWFILHTAPRYKSSSSAAIVKDLIKSHPVWANYQKGSLTREQSNLLMDRKSAAIANSKLLDWPENPSSNMHDLIQAIENC